jgi:hypothetical protein
MGMACFGAAEPDRPHGSGKPLCREAAEQRRVGDTAELRFGGLFSLVVGAQAFPEADDAPYEPGKRTTLRSKFLRARLAASFIRSEPRRSTSSVST